MDLNLLLQQGPASVSQNDTWARLCCEQAISALESGNYAVGALIVDHDNQLMCSAANNVFSEGYRSERHAEMEVLTQLEKLYPEIDRSKLTLYVTLEPCLMCYGRILLSGIRNVRYLAKDSPGGFADHIHLLPAAWRDLAGRVSVEPMKVDAYWMTLATKLISEYQNRDEMREKVKTAWAGQSSD